ncbi:MAG: helix-turn-helix domain-containing protein [Lutibacter sp.]
MLIISIFSSNEDFKLYLNHNIHGTALSSSNASLLDFVYNWARYVHLAQIVVYTFLAIRIIIIGKKAIYNTFSNLTKLQITNFFIVTSSFILLMSIPGFYITYMGRQPFSEEEISLFYLAIIFTLLYLILALIGLKQQPVEEHLIHKNKPISKNLSELELKLTNYFNKNEAWKKSDLTIWDVSKSLGTNRSYISQIINNKHQCNFNAFVNYYRINYAKKILSNNKNLTLVEVSEKSGFGSLNSFIRIFKKFTKQTPSAFRKENT